MASRRITSPRATEPDFVLYNLTPLHDRISVKHLEKRQTLITVIRENPSMVDMVKQGLNGEHDDNRRVGIVSRVLAVGSSVKGVKKGDAILHTDWNDLPEWLDAPKGYAMIREGDVWGHVDAEALGYEA